MGFVVVVSGFGFRVWVLGFGFGDLGTSATGSCAARSTK